MIEYFSGYVQSISFEDPSTGFYIFRVQLDSRREANAFVMSGDTFSTAATTAKGYVAGIKLEVGTWIPFEASWITHPKYGNQLDIVSAPAAPLDWDVNFLQRSLRSEDLNLDLQSAERKLGSPIKAVLDKSDVDTLKVLGVANPQKVLQAYHKLRTFHQGLGYLQKIGCTSQQVAAIWSTFGDESEAVVSGNPWDLCQIEGFTFAQTDELALRMGLSLDDPRRVQGAVRSLFTDPSPEGHTYYDLGQVLYAVQNLIPSLAQKDFGEALIALRDAGVIKVDKKTRPGTTAIYSALMFQYETEAAKGLRDRVNTASFANLPQDAETYRKALSGVGTATTQAIESGASLTSVVDTALEDWCNQHGLSLSLMQQKAVKNALLEPVSIMTGLPGSGKTTSSRAIVNILVDAGVHVLLCAPTGIAAKRLSAVTGQPAWTIHKAFGAQGTNSKADAATYSGVQKKENQANSLTFDQSEWDPENSHPAQVILVDECSMIDMHLIYQILRCTQPTSRIIFVGDDAQLPSVGPGNVLRQLIESKKFPTVKLTEIFRQANNSDIVLAAHAFQDGIMPKYSTNPSDDFVLMPKSSEEAVFDAMVCQAQELFEHRANFQVMSPRHGGPCGVTRLNETLRELLNPRTPGLEEIKIGKEVVREGDRIMVVKNDYLLGLFNGDLGKIERIDKRNKEIHLKIHGSPPVIVPLSLEKARTMLRLAYATTVHKCQGLEFDTIVMPVVSGFRHQLQRNLYYTGITRAKKRVLLFGHDQALFQAVMNNREDARNSLFLERLSAE